MGTGVAVILLASEDSRWGAMGEEKEDVADDTANEADNEDAEEDQDEEPEMSNHPKVRECKEKAEQIEKDHGIFDDKDMTEEKQMSIVEGLKGIATELLGKHKDDFHDKMYEKLGPAGKEAFGASDACNCMFKHHGEL